MKTPLLIALLAVSPLFAGCGGGSCETACESVRECSNSSLNVESCSRECEEANERSEAHARRVDACAECTADRSCAEKGEFCRQECSDIDGFDED